ncbi:hypothetical protein LguiB_017507 [Lonicera macranthoides]
MAMAISSMASQSSIVVFDMKTSQRFQSNLLRPSCNLGLPKLRIGSGFLVMTPRLNDFSTIKIKRDFVVNSSSISPGGSGSPSNSMRGWLLGMVLTIVLPFFTHKWGPLLKWTKNIESVVETVEQIANTVESAAGKIHEVAENIEESLPQGKLRDAFDFIENTAEEIAKGADVAGDLIDKIQEVEDKVEAFIEQSEQAKETHKVATTTTTTTTTTARSVAAAQAETQNGDVEPTDTVNVEINKVVKEEVVTSI